MMIMLTAHSDRQRHFFRNNLLRNDEPNFASFVGKLNLIKFKTN